MSSEWLTTMKPTFQTEWLALPPKIAHQILEKIHYLTQDPLPDGDLKKQLTYINRDVYRLESGDYRIMYTLQRPYISLLRLEKRQESTYKGEFKSEFLGGYNPDEETLSERMDKYTQEGAPIPFAQALPSPITKDLLVNLLIPAQYHPALLAIDNEDSLLDASHVPDEYKLKVHTALFEKPLSQVFEEADYLLPETNSLMRYKEGDLLAFLLKLSPEQEKFVSWGLTSAGPTLLKGGPGTGKSAIALHRVYALIQEFRQRGHDDFRILFTTYTNALVHSSRQLLEQLLGKDIAFVEVSTADLIARDILKEAGKQVEIIEPQELDDLLLQAMQEASYTGSAVQQKAQRQFIEALNFDYLLQEINRVIIANELESLEQYLAASRPGRQMPLNALQRRAAWSVHEKLEQLLAREQKMTWHQLRAQAEKMVAQRRVTRQFEAVIIDEAQDLDPSALRLMTRLCKTPRGLFITADANQSIYGSHFTWSSIHKDLQFRGRTGILHANYRSTREIGEAAQSYLQQGILDSDPVEREYTYNGPLPIVRKINNDQEEVQLLASFLAAAKRTSRLGIGSCAILCPNEKVGRSLATALERYQIEAVFMSGQYLDLKRSCVKILTLNAAKGLEFPIVALAGFHKVNKYMRKPSQPTPEEQNEALALERRLLFVGMTRAMRALLLAIPTTSKSPLFEGFDQRYWNTEQS